jgi:N-acetylmuramoyl-L-alanine amidase
MKVKPRYTFIILTIGILLGLGLGKLTLEPKLIVETEYRTITRYIDKPYIAMSSVSPEEIIVLGKLVEAEATGGTIKQKVNVARVVLNRVKSDRFPNTIKEVVFQLNQFSPINDKRYYSIKISDDTIKAITQAFSQSDVYSNNVMWFMNEKHSSKKNVDWFKSNLTYMYDDGLHQYYGR